MLQARSALAKYGERGGGVKKHGPFWGTIHIRGHIKWGPETGL